MANPVIANLDGLKIPVFNPKYDDVVVEVNGAVTLAAGTVLAFEATDENYQPAVSGTAAVDVPSAVLIDPITVTAAATTKARVLIGGEVAVDALVFDGSDTIDTKPAGAPDTFRVSLRNYGIIARDGLRVDEQDNQ